MHLRTREQAGEGESPGGKHQPSQAGLTTGRLGFTLRGLCVVYLHRSFKL